jgi:hypothetical protein
MTSTCEYLVTGKSKTKNNYIISFSIVGQLHIFKSFLCHPCRDKEHQATPVVGLTAMVEGQQRKTTARISEKHLFM